MKILITGWYGTETIGDRAILASLLMHVTSILKEVEICIASIYPFHTERTIIEDSWLYKNICEIPESIIENIKIVDSRSYGKYTEAITNCDLLIMGGGPFDDMASMYMVEYGFRLAKRKGKKTLVYGCGLNVLKKKQYKQSVFNILDNSDSIILRDKKSINLLNKYGYQDVGRIIESIDPAVFVAQEYKKKSRTNNEDFVVVNLRDFPEIYSDNSEVKTDTINQLSFSYVREFLHTTNANQSYGIAMNYFAVGGDDRNILNECKHKTDIELFVINKPLNLQETMDYYMHAKYCLGMRFHAVVLQTILNGNNYILNYTSSENGKIPGFIEQIHGQQFFEERSVNLQEKDKKNTWNISEKHFKTPSKLIDWYGSLYVDEMKKMI